MPDNTILLPGGGGDTIRATDRNGVLTQIVRLDVGNAQEQILLAGQQGVNSSVSVVLASGHAAVAVSTASPWPCDLAQYAGAAVGAGNALHVRPGTGATWSVTTPSAWPCDLTHYAGAAVGAGNALHVRPGTGATWSVTTPSAWPCDLTQYAGAAVGAGNALHVRPGTGATWSVQETGSALTSLQTLDDLVLSEDASHVSGDKGVMALAVRRDTAGAFAADGDYVPLQVDAAGALRVNVVAGPAGGTSATDHAVFTSGASVGTPIMGARTTTAALPAGERLGICAITPFRALHVTLHDSAGNELGVGGGTQYDEDTAHVSGDKLNLAGVVRRDTPTSGVSDDGDRATLSIGATGRLWCSTTIDSPLPSGTNAIGSVSVTSLPAHATVDITRVGGTTVSTGNGTANAGCLRVAIASDTSDVPIRLRPQTSGGLSIHRVISAAGTNGQSVKTSAGQVYGWYLFNSNTATRVLKIYNKASAPTVGTDTPVLTIPIPGGAAANVEFTLGIPCSAGIAMAITTGIPDSDTGAVAANEVVVNLLYQ